MACAVLPYSSARFAELRDLGAATDAFAPARDGGAVRTLTALLSKHGVADMAGVMLLHAHFDMAADERLVQRGAGVAHPTTAPGGVPYVFMCAPGGAGVAPLEYVDVDTEHYETALARLTGAPAFVAEYAAALEALALTDVVGLTILPPTHVCKPGEWLLEYSSAKDDRQLELKVFPVGAGCDSAFGAYDVVWVAGGIIERRCIILDNTNVRRHVKGKGGPQDEQDAGGVIERRCIILDNTNVRRHVKGKGGPQDDQQSAGGIIQRRCISSDRGHTKGKGGPQ